MSYHGAALAPLLERSMAVGLKPMEGFITNWLGVRTSASFFGRGVDFEGRVFADLPIPDDGVYGGLIEYAAVCQAVEEAGRSFSMVELGAGWGPWVSAAGVLARRKGIEQIRLVAVEASSARIKTLHAHLADNGLSDVTQAVFGAAWTEDGALRFPKVGVLDHGGAASTDRNNLTRDYRNLEVEMEDVPAYSVQTLCEGLGVVDLMHWDIQGAEAEVADACIDFLNENVRRVFIGTHSRMIEGRLLETFHKAGWSLVIEKACELRFDRSKPDVIGMTTTDGEQYWINPRLA